MIYNRENLLNTIVLCQNEQELKKLWYKLYQNGIKMMWIDTINRPTYEDVYKSLYVDNRGSYKVDEPIWFMICELGQGMTMPGQSYSDWWFYFRPHKDWNQYVDWDKYREIKYHKFFRKEKLLYLNKLCLK